MQVNLRNPHADEDDHEELYETELVMNHSHVEVENEKIFFARLDGQLNKVNQFYRKKEQEFYEKAEEIKEQLEKLVAVRKKLKEQQNYSVSESSFEKGSENGKPDPAMEDIELSPISENDASLDDSTGEPNTYATSTARDFGLTIPQDTPSLLFGALKQKVMDDLSSHSGQPTAGEGLPSNTFNRFDRRRIQYAERTLRDACQELYRGLGYLRRFSSNIFSSLDYEQEFPFCNLFFSQHTIFKILPNKIFMTEALAENGLCKLFVNSYSTLNATAFAKILKKYDKKTGKDASIVYMKVVENAYFQSSDKVLNMMDGLEKKFTEVFTNGNHKKSMALLKPVPKSASHKVTFFLGLFTGCTFSCLVAFFVLLDFKWIRNNDDTSENAMNLYLHAIYPLFSILALVLLHLCLYGWNLYSWREKQINYAFIFGLTPGTEIKYRELLLLAMGLATLVTATLLGHFMIYTIVTSSFQTASMPFSILMVVMVDFFLADQLSSQVYMFRNVEYVLCYSILGHFKEENIDLCTSDNLHFVIVAYVVSMVPYWWQFAQGQHVSEVSCQMVGSRASSLAVFSSRQPSRLCDRAMTEHII
ncbi:hypothetical protein GOP47_0028235 [Adiantum capillus-veneris]|nr:hypothetical protein GOP47_0028235 [Adiantum capillus-veneris]